MTTDDDDYCLVADESICDLIQRLRNMNAFIPSADCPGSIYVDIPAYVLTDLTAWLLDHWREDGPMIGRAAVLAQLANSLAYMFGSFIDGEPLSDEVRAVVVALEALEAAAGAASRH